MVQCTHRVLGDFELDFNKVYATWCLSMMVQKKIQGELKIFLGPKRKIKFFKYLQNPLGTFEYFSHTHKKILINACFLYL